MRGVPLSLKTIPVNRTTMPALNGAVVSNWALLSTYTATIGAPLRAGMKS